MITEGMAHLESVPFLCVHVQRFNLENAGAAHLQRCVKLDMALPFRRFTRLASAPHLRFQSIFLVKEKDNAFEAESQSAV
jgi:hypothetical protein